MANTGPTVAGTSQHWALTSSWKAFLKMWTGLLKYCFSLPCWARFRSERQQVAFGQATLRPRDQPAFEAWLRAYRDRLETSCRPPNIRNSPGKGI